MAPEKRNHFLDADESDHDHSPGYDSEADEFRKGGRSAKRRRVESESDDEGGFSSEEDEATDDQGDGQDVDQDDDQEDGQEDRKADEEHSSPTQQLRAESENAAAADDDSTAKPEAKKAKREPTLRDVSENPLKKNLVVTDAQIKKSGVVYLSRVPPFMKPMKLRSLLQPWGKINRVFLSPEDPQARSRRLRAGGNKRKNYTDGWVEFVSKKDAKAAAEALNGRTIGGKKGGFYRDDMWTLLYLKGFKWHNLTEQIATENAERESRMRAEISKATRENREFVRNVERAKVLDGMQAKKKARQSSSKGGRGERGGDDVAVAANAAADATDDVETSYLGRDGDETKAHGSRTDRPRTFKQVAVARKKGEAEQNDQVKRVLGKIF